MPKVLFLPKMATSYEHQELIRDLNNRIELFKSKYLALMKANERIASEKNELLNQIEEDKKKISILEQRNNSAELAQSISPDGVGADQAKLQIMRIVREIDECIALLNK